LKSREHLYLEQGAEILAILLETIPQALDFGYFSRLDEIQTKLNSLSEDPKVGDVTRHEEPKRMTSQVMEGQWVEIIRTTKTSLGPDDFICILTSFIVREDRLKLLECVAITILLKACLMTKILDARGFEKRGRLHGFSCSFYVRCT
jgi:hypothetical protein